MCTVYGYARVSTLRQKLERQIDNIKAVRPDAVIVTEKYTGTSIDRPAFTRLLEKLKSGDTIIFDSVSRMSRTAEEGYKLYMDLYQKGINLEFIKEPMINTDVFRQTAQLAMTGTDVDCVLDGINKYLMILAEKQIKIAFDQSEKEVTDLHGRISEGLAQAKLRGSQVGREQGRKYQSRKSVEMKAKIAKMSKDITGTMTDKEVMDILGIARNTYYKYKRELIEQSEA
jgi:DNA invertase Pin-like site-specific DNA recombinase